MAHDVSQSTVKVFGQEGVGTGFVLGQDIIVTCAHVVGKADSQPKIVFSANGEERLNQPVMFYSAEEEYDIAVLQLQGGLPENVMPLKLGRSVGSSGHSFHTFGYPQLQPLEGLHCEGKIEGEVKDENRRPFLQITSKQITSGVSGAPLLDDETGRIVGMVVWAAIKEWEHLEERIKAAIGERKPDIKFLSAVIPDTAFAIPAETLHRLLHDKFPTLQLHPPQALDDYLDQVRAYCDQDPYRVWDIRPKALEEIYVPLQLRYRPPIETRTAGDAPSQEKPPEQILPAAEALAKSGKPHLIILAGPGAGKSTLLRQFANNAWDAPQTIGLTTPHIPVPLPLGKLDTEVSFEVGIAKVLTGELALRQDLPSGYWDQWPAQTEARWLILLDALDEVPSARRQKIIERLRALSQRPDGCRIVITSRPSGYKYGELDPELFMHCELEPFGPPQVQAFSRNWLGDEAESFLVQYDRLEAGDLKNTPLLLTLAAKLYKETHALPPQRSALYGELVERTLDRAIEDGLNTELGDKLAADLTLHEFRLSYLAQRMTAAEETLDEESIEGFLAYYFQDNEGLPKVLAKTCAKQWIEKMGARSGLLIGKQGSYVFLHSTVREYLAAKYLLENEVLQQILKTYWHQPMYEEILAFAVSIRATKHAGAADIVEALTWLVDYGDETYQQNPQELLAIGRSPLRTALHLVRSAGLFLTDLAGVAECLRTRISVSELRQRAVAGDSRTPDLILQWLSEVGSKSVQGHVAQNPNTPPEVLKRLAEVGSEGVQTGLAANLNTPPEILKHLAEVGNEEVQTRVAKNPNTPPEVLKPLPEVGSVDLQWMVAESHHTPEELNRLREKSLQWRVAENLHTPPEVLKHLAEVGSEDVQLKVALNPNAPADVLKHLAEGRGSPFYENVQCAVAINPRTPPEVLKRLAEGDSEIVQWMVAENPNTPPEVLKQLAKGGSENVQLRVGQNPNTPPEILKLLAEGGNEAVQQIIVRLSNVILETL